MDQTTLLYVLAAALILVGLAGTVLPALPGLPLVFVGMLLAAWAGDFQLIPVWIVGVLGLLAALAMAADLVAGVLGAQRVGASRLALVGAAIGTLIGLLFGLPGLIFCPFAGAVIGEVLHGRRIGEATRVGFGTWLGMAFGAISKLALAFVMLGVFVLALLL